MSLTGRTHPLERQELVQEPHISAGLGGVETEEPQGGQSVVDVDKNNVVVEEIVPAQGGVGAPGEASPVYEDNDGEQPLMVGDGGGGGEGGEDGQVETVLGARH